MAIFQCLCFFQTVYNIVIFYNKKLLATFENPKLEDYTLFTVCNYFFTIITFTCHTWGRAVA
jgi:hypothetical protein